MVWTVHWGDTGAGRATSNDGLDGPVVARRVPVLMYHYVEPAASGDDTINSEAKRRSCRP